ncbi:MAG: MBL fold metallo-hydrolase [Candidatus Yanofskybacteria bacterium]|nr:MBL fold metallo-hydrolase [Candidatus Yanofskybacteria bacterium]
MKFEMGENISKKEWAILGGLVLVAFLSFSFGSNDGLLHIYFLDVGQGDAIFVETPSGKQILIDGGPDETILQRLGEVMPFYDRVIDLVINTHPDADHLAGLLSVLERYKVLAIAETGMACETSLCAEWKNLKTDEGADLINLVLGQEMEAGGARFLVLHPFEDETGKTFSKRNNGGIVLKLVFGSQSLLLTGDIEKQVENKLVSAGINIDSDFLKIAHHGSKTSSTEEFIKKVSPLAAFIEVGRNNKYGHPTEEVINRLADFKIPYYRTDIDGTVELRLDRAGGYKVIK